MIPLLVVLTSGGLLFLALVETAFGLLMRLPQRLEAERESGNTALVAYLDDPLKFFIPARLMRGTLLVFLVVFLAQPIGTGFPAALGLAASSIAIVIGLGQILPALIVRRSPERFLDLLLPPFTAVANVTGPFTALIIGWTGTAGRRSANGDATRGSPESAVLDEPGEHATGNANLLRSVVDFGETLVREVMTPRPDIVAIPSSATIDDLRRLVREQEYSRLPVYTENLDNMVGLIVVKDLIQMTAEPDGTRHISDMMRPAAFVPETKRVVDLLREFQQGRFQLAIVVDEYGGTAGIVTVEDVVEELVGEIRDEYDVEAEPIVRESDDTFVFSAKVGIGEMSERLGVTIDDGEFETVGGFVLARVGRVPAVGERFDIDELNVEILEAERRRIHKVRIRRLTPAADAGVEG
ncbi:MAG: hemolysin family protein [Vicinamibacterales bacterium]